MKSYFKQRTQKLFFGKLSQTLMMMPIITTVLLMFPGNLYAQTKTSYLLPDGKEYVSWEVPVTYSKTYYVDNGNPNASDNNEGTQERPFLTVSKASEVLQPGERVVINSGVYREQVRPRQGGSAAEWRIVAGGGGTSRWNHVENNLFYNCTKAIDFSSRDNFAEGNLYGRRGNTGSMRNRIFYLEKLEPDVTGWQRYFGFDKTGGYVNVDVRINSDDMTMTWSSEYDVANITTGTHYKTDYFKKTAAKNRKAGPFIDFPENDKTINIDPRVKP